jgi:hypothetical protein
MLTTSSLSLAFVQGVYDYNKKKTLKPGKGADLFYYTKENFKNRRFKVNVTVMNTVPPDRYIYVFFMRRDSYFDWRDNDTAISELDDVLYTNYEVNSENSIQFEVVIPDWDYWTFVFYNPNDVDVPTVIKISHRHVYWWLWIVIPSMVVVGLAGYGLFEKFTKYQRARMYSDKALGKLGGRTREGERKRAAYWLVRNGTREDIDELLPLLQDDDPVIRVNAAFSIGGISKRIGDISASDEIVTALKAEENEKVKEAFVSALTDIGDPQTHSILEEYLLLDHNEKLRYSIARRLGEIGSLDSVKGLVTVINSKNTDSLKFASKNALASIADKHDTTVEKLKKKYAKAG